MPSNALAVFHRNLQRINNTRSRMEVLYSNGSIKKTDIEAVYEALFLRAVTNFESFIEELFISVLLGRSGHAADRVKLQMTVNSRASLISIVYQRGEYLDWLPYKKTEDRARLYLKDGRPFSDLNDGDKSQIRLISFVRNAIAHKSEHATAQFREKVIGSMALLPNEKRPAGFLRSVARINPRQVRFEIYVSELGRIAAVLA